MSLVQLSNIVCGANPTNFLTPFSFEITFECLPPGVKEELEWKLIYVGSSDDKKYDQELESVLVGPVTLGRNRFTFEAPAPNPELIPKKDLCEVTVLLLSCSYKEREFIRVGYYVSNDNSDVKAVPEGEPKPVPTEINIAHVTRNILIDKPRVTRFQIPWDDAMTESQLYGLPDPATITEQQAQADDMEDEKDDEGDEEAQQPSGASSQSQSQSQSMSSGSSGSNANNSNANANAPNSVSSGSNNSKAPASVSMDTSSD